MIFRYTETPSVNSLLFEKMLWAAKVKKSQEGETPSFRARDYSKSIASPSPPEHHKLRVDIERRESSGRAVHILSPKSGIGSSLVLFLHGGSYIVNATRPHWKFLVHLVEKAGCSILAPDYPLAPEYCYSDAYTMLIELYRDLLGISPRPNIALMGDSAGGGLALGLAEMIRDERMTQPKAVIMLSPWLDVTEQSSY